ncbi:MULTISPECIES: hypothetical protein [Streptomyces]|uniref:Uncharacterized protein n=1 Tax=Streptomyces canarius TaxID=285453 RepID=A0ABQ3DDP0_9ACTN|nr:hypothetical protein [Streptomyces canarius]GHA72696.1 hypothetical protein GCM10010345_89520 [Streptomyces canarius]
MNDTSAQMKITDSMIAYAVSADASNTCDAVDEVVVAADRWRTATDLMRACRTPPDRTSPGSFAPCSEVVERRRSCTLHGVVRYAVDPDDARRLWTLSQELLAPAR